MTKQQKAAHELYRSEHSVTAIAQRLSSGNRNDYLKDFVYGSIDGAVTTFAVVSGVAGAGLSSNIILILGIANLLGDGFSMAASNFLGTKADMQLRDKARATEEKHIELFPEGEVEEVRQIFQAKGFSGEDLERAVAVITASKKRWVDTMLTEELGYSLTRLSPIRSALATFTAFCVVGFLPLIAFLVGPALPSPFLVSSILTAAAFFTVGALKSKFTETNWLLSGLETLLVGGAAASLAYLAGYLLKGVFV